MQGQTSGYVLTTVVAPPASSGLTTLANVKDELKITDTENDSFLNRAIPQASAAIARYCNRVFGKATWQDEFRLQRGIWGEGVKASNNPLTLARVPLVSVTSVVETVAGVDTTLVAGTDFEIEQASLLPGDEGAARLYRLNQLGNPRTWPSAKVVVVYVAGYALPGDTSPNMPPDLEDACLRLVTARFKARGRDPMLKSEGEPGLGQQQYWVGPTPGQDGALPPEIEALVDPYRVPVTAST